MTPIIYFFGTLPEGFSTYPVDHTKKIFSDFILKSKNDSQIILHRKDNLLYYGYVRKISNNNFLGICLCIDCIYNNVSHLFRVFDDIYASMIEKGDILKIGLKKNIYWATKNFVSESVATIEYTKQLIDVISISEKYTEPLTPVDFSISINDCISLSLEDPNRIIIDAIKRYTNLYIVKKNSEIERVNSFHATITQKDNEINDLKASLHNQKRETANLKNNLLKAKTKQRNMALVTLLVIVVLIFGFELWNKVLFPSEVTHYETGEFVYYGPLKNNKPDGIGVAIYPTDDKDGRKYYIGNFVAGERQDTAAILFYQDGDYFYGSMKGDKWEKGILYMNSDNSHFSGSFKDNEPFNGTWFDHKKLYYLKYGEKVYH